MKLTEYIDPNLLSTMLVNGFIKRQNHPTMGLEILNYTAKAQYEQCWNDATRKCRGLIVSWTDDEVVARPFEKFFNIEQVPYLPDEPYEVLEKADGSLGILYPTTHGKYAIATRGSFTSDQARHATSVLEARYPDFEPVEGMTYLFEIIYPENRIVVNYGDRDDLVLLDIISTRTGDSYLRRCENTWPGPVINTYRHLTIEELTAKGFGFAVHGDSAEGFVLRYESGFRVKVKFEDYIRLHRIVTGVSSKTIWTYLSEGKDMAEILDRVPDEFYSWVEETVATLRTSFARTHNDVGEEFYRTFMKVAAPTFAKPTDPEFRKAFAREAAGSKYKGLLFKLLDGKSIDEQVWKIVKPSFERPFSNRTEDNN